MSIEKGAYYWWARVEVVGAREPLLALLVRTLQ